VLAALADVRSSGIVLIAEDDPDFGPQLREIVADSGYRAELVRNGRDAIDAVRRGGVEVLILDLKMPLIDGIEVYTTLKHEGRAVPTIIITGSAHEYHDTLEAIRDVTLTGILNKPFDPLTLLQSLERLAA
jgi:CheY-like chemotaxis protein